MVDALSSNGFTPQIPAANTFRPGEIQPQQKPADTLQQNTAGRSTNAATQTQTAPGKTEEIASKLSLSRNNTRPAPNDPFASPNARGSQLDIKV